MIERCRSSLGQDRLEVGDLGHQLVVLVLHPLPFERGQPAQLHVEDRGGLHLVDLEQRHQPGPGGLGRLAAADQRDDLVDPVLRLEQRDQDVRALLRLAQQELGPPDDDLDLMDDVVA